MKKKPRIGIARKPTVFKNELVEIKPKKKPELTVKKIQEYISIAMIQNIDGIKRQLSNPLLAENNRIYWIGQWDGISNIARALNIEVERRP